MVISVDTVLDSRCSAHVTGDMKKHQVSSGPWSYISFACT